MKEKTINFVHYTKYTIAGNSKFPTIETIIKLIADLFFL